MATNEKSFYVSLADSIAAEVMKNPNLGLSEAVSETASMKNLSTDEVYALIPHANNQYVLRNPEDRFRAPATREDVISYMKGDNSIGRTKVAYHYPEFNNSMSRSKTASMDEEVPLTKPAPIDFTHVIREQSRLKTASLQQERTNLCASMEPHFNTIKAEIDVLKTLGVTSNELRSKLASLGADKATRVLVNTVYTNSRKVKSASANPVLYNIPQRIETVFNSAKILKEKTAQLLQINAKYKEAESEKETIYNAGKLFLE